MELPGTQPGTAPQGSAAAAQGGGPLIEIQSLGLGRAVNLEKIDCSFGHACPELYHPRVILDVQVGKHILMAMVDTRCVQTLVV